MQTYVEEEELVIAPLIDARTQPGGVTCSKIYVMSVIICSNFIVGPLCYIILLPVHSAVFGSGKRRPTGLLERLARTKKGVSIVILSLVPFPHDTKMAIELEILRVA